MFWTFMTALWVVMLVAPIALLVALLPAGRECPRCGSETLPILVAVLRPVRGVLGRRWCTACGWEGLVRVTRQPAEPVADVVPEVVHEETVDDDAAWRGERDSGGGVM